MASAAAAAAATAAAIVVASSACPFKGLLTTGGDGRGAGGGRRLLAPHPSLTRRGRALVQAQEDEGLPPPVCASTGGAPAPVEPGPACEAAASIRQQVFAALDAAERAAGGGDPGRAARAALSGALVRAAFHDAAEYDRGAADAAGPDGCLSPSPDNAGLVEPDQEVRAVLEPMWQSVCAGLSRADAWVAAAQAALADADPTGFLAEESLTFAYGRADSPPSGCGGAGAPERLPDGALGGPALLTGAFVDRMGLSVEDAVALLGGHTLGHMHPAHSGFGRAGEPATPWVNAPHRFDSSYFEDIVDDRWDTERAPNGNVQWRDGGRVMLNVDMALGFDIGAEAGDPSEAVCGGRGNRCARAAWARGQVDRYIASNAAFLADWAAAFRRLTSVGYGGGVTAAGTPDTRLGPALATVDLGSCQAPNSDDGSNLPPASGPIGPPDAEEEEGGDDDGDSVGGQGGDGDDDDEGGGAGGGDDDDDGRGGGGDDDDDGRGGGGNGDDDDGDDDGQSESDGDEDGDSECSDRRRGPPCGSGAEATSPTVAGDGAGDDRSVTPTSAAARPAAGGVAAALTAAGLAVAGALAF